LTDARESWVIVSGAGGALGRALAERYAASGSKVLALDQDGARLAALRAIPGLVTQAADLANPEALQSALDAAIPRREPIGLLVNAVGMIWNEPILALRGASFSAHSIETFDSVLRANVTAAFVTATRVAARMARTGGGSIINFSSISASGNVGQVAYSSAKAAIEGMTRAMAQELGPLKIRVNAIAPGFIDVPTTRTAVPETVLADYARRTPAGRLGAIEELADAIDSLAKNHFLNGVVLRLDGGLRL
jgi:3-oxoacyl-[acyl-carrier protein] reductase